MSRATSGGHSAAFLRTTTSGSSRVHHLRHTVGSLLKDLGVPARDAQTILGHTRISTTLEIYTDTNDDARRDALTRLEGLLGEADDED